MKSWHLMTSYAEHLGIDLDKLEAERHHYYPRPKYSSKTINGQYVINAITAPLDCSEDWQPITRAANAIRYHVESIRRLTKAGAIRWEKRNGRTWVYYPDVLRHAGKR
jgi:hypothetical protein